MGGGCPQGGGEEGASGGLQVCSGGLPVTLPNVWEALPMQTFCRKCPPPPTMSTYLKSGFDGVILSLKGQVQGHFWSAQLDGGPSRAGSCIWEGETRGAAKRASAHRTAPRPRTVRPPDPQSTLVSSAEAEKSQFTGFSFSPHTLNPLWDSDNPKATIHPDGDPIPHRTGVS